MLDLSLATARRFRGLTIHPLLTAGDEPFGVDLLGEAIRAGTLKITEVGAGTVPSLLAINAGERDVLVLDGERFLGAKQNRMASRSILLPAMSETEIPVNCMEQGRWRHVRPDFHGSDYHSPSRVRRHNKRVEARMARAGRAAEPASLGAAQGAVWQEISLLSADLDARSETGDLEEVTRRKADDLADAVRRFPALPGQVGILAFLGPEPLGLDAIGDRTLWARVHARVVGGYVQDALRRGGEDPAKPDPEAGETWLAAVRNAARTPAPTVGAGAYRVLSGPVTGGELLAGDRTVHLSAFPLAEEPR